MYIKPSKKSVQVLKNSSVAITAILLRVIFPHRQVHSESIGIGAQMILAPTWRVPPAGNETTWKTTNPKMEQNTWPPLFTGGKTRNMIGKYRKHICITHRLYFQFAIYSSDRNMKQLS